jgi:hypothetical protein
MEDKSGNLYKQISAQFSSDCEAEWQEASENTKDLNYTGN